MKHKTIWDISASLYGTSIAMLSASEAAKHIDTHNINAAIIFGATAAVALIITTPKIVNIAADAIMYDINRA